MALNSKLLLGIVILVYFLTASLYAIYTPPWQTPDEPAHYNYIAYLAKWGQLPILDFGDYDQKYLEALTSRKFPPDLSIAPLRYEFHQPPLYYALATPLYLATQSMDPREQVIILRLFSVLIGTLLLPLAYRIFAIVFPEQPFVPLTATAFIAVLPQHLMVAAAVNNDILAEVVLAAIIMVSLIAIRDGIEQKHAVTLGVVLGIALITKTTIYLPAVLAVGAAVLWGRQGWRPLVTIFAVAFIISGWWFLRNACCAYGYADIFGWARHDKVVAGQPTTAEWLAQYGFGYVTTAFMTTTFRSFWGQFGWMGVLMDARIYLALLIITVAVLLGFLLWFRKWREIRVFQKQALLLFSVLLIAVILSYLGYNLRFVQHQGRYLFPALVPISVFFALGIFAWVGLWAQAIARPMPAHSPRLTALAPAELVVFALFYLSFLALDLIALFWFIIPQLSIPA